MLKTDEEICSDILVAIEASVAQVIRKHGNCAQLGEMGTCFYVGENGKVSLHGVLPGSRRREVSETKLQLLIDLVDLDQIRSMLGLDFALRWGGALVVRVSFEYDDRKLGLGWNMWEPEVSTYAACHERTYIAWLWQKHMDDAGMTVAERPAVSVIAL